MKSNLLILCLATLSLATSGLAAPTTDDARQQIVESLKWRYEGSIALEQDVATIKLRDGFRFLDSADASKVLTDLWGNPKHATLGMLFPRENPDSDGVWAVIVEGFEKEGYVKDEDADKLDADKMLQDIQNGQKEANAQRRQQGFSELEIVGWAMPPRYDKLTKKLTWALDIQAIGSERHSVNYYVRILGRRGYLVLNALGGLDQVKEIEAATPQVLAMVEFNDGHRYADFDAKKGDKVATYGLAGLIFGAVGLKVAAKLGLIALFAKKFGFILLFLKKFVVILVALVAAVFSRIKGFFTARKITHPPPAEKPQSD
ncbi:MAG: DUF2167 domain-containing protein [Verrucomicrobia bacterium]|nr:MAG: DUF2167 domain-containing protein [Verrucomicrobiota bacterium]